MWRMYGSKGDPLATLNNGMHCMEWSNDIPFHMRNFTLCYAEQGDPRIRTFYNVHLYARCLIRMITLFIIHT